MTRVLMGVDIGGTKCAIVAGRVVAGAIQILGKRRFPTPSSPQVTLDTIVRELAALAGELAAAPAAVGVSCGGPLDSRAGLVLAPPNLPGWDHIDVLTPLRTHFGVPVALHNDANACALAEWTWGAGRGCRSMIFLTFGTGLGAGLILDGRLYEGANGLAGEVGHARLSEEGPVGHGKAGSFEGWCSGGGIAQLARAMADAHLRMGASAAFCRTLDDLPSITAQTVGEAAEQGDELALRVYEAVGRRLGLGLALLVDTLNPERIVIGGIYARQRALLELVSLRTLREEALPGAVAACTVVPAALGEAVGDLASLSVARHTLEGLYIDDEDVADA